MKIGFVSILGRPNVGKSTLLNALLSKKVSIVSPKAQTTRDAISGILNEKDYQIVFVDTPGIFYGKEKLYSLMKKTAFESSRDVNAIIYMIDASTKTLDEDIKIYNSINSDAPRIVVLNKIDLIKAEEAKEKKEIISENMKSVLLIEASIKENFGLKEIKDGLYSYLEEGEPFYPTNIITDKDKAYQAKEIIRGKLLHFLRQEIPHQCAVVISSFKENDDKIEISAKIVTEKENQKGIIIGKGGNMIKSIKTAAKKEMETSWHKNVASLKIEVEADPGWRDSIKKLIEYGYGE
ncbi:MAG: GTPase Era [Candidatus Enteromonas sp.]|nr:GTPase Era [Mollicutes bacterium]MDY4936033.1 GTPase Era [Candidatus Enteromonas sp.]